MAWTLADRAQDRPDDVALAMSGSGRVVSAGELDRDARAIAAYLGDVARPGDRVLLVLPPGIEYVAAFLGCLYAGVIAVPIYPPRPGARIDRITSVIRDCRPGHAFVVEAGPLAALLREHPIRRALAVQETTSPVDARADDLAFLQYTSGSTGDPKGVMVTHGNLAANLRAIVGRFGIGRHDVVASWLPPYHDMGLIGTVLLPLHVGIKTVLTNTFDFLRDPLGWPKTVARHGATCSGGPDTGYRMLVERYSPEALDGIDLGSWRIAFTGAEPVDQVTLTAFAARYASHGLRPSAIFPCYGLAEATLLVSGATPGGGHRATRFDRASAGAGKLVETAASTARTVVSVGTVASGTDVLIRTEDGEEAPSAAIGEICVQGPGVAAGYWEDTERTEEFFRATVTGHAGVFLRTGDLGGWFGGELYVLGRAKDLIVVAGRNIDPRDVELAVEDGLLRRGEAAAFQLEDGQVVVVQEAARPALASCRRDGAALRGACESVKESVADRCGLYLDQVVIAWPGALPRTSSGKIRRAETRRAFLVGELKLLRADLARGSAPNAPPDRPRLSEFLAGLLAERTAEVLPDVPLAALGLDSLQLTELRTAVERHLGHPVDGTLFFGDLSVDHIVNELARDDRQGTSRPVLVPAAVPGTEVPLSEGQAQLLFHDLLRPEGVANNIPCVLRIERQFAVADVRRAVAAVIGRHCALHTTFGAIGSGVQYVRDPSWFGWDSIEADDEAAIRAWLAEMAFRRFDFTGGPLVRAGAALTPAATTVSLVCHHAVIDYWSLRIVVDELLGELLGEPAPHSPTADLPGWIAAERERLATSRVQIELARMERKWAPLRAHVLFPPGAGAHRRDPASTVDFTIDPKTTAGLYTHSKARGFTPIVTVAAAYLRALHLVTGHEKVVVGIPHHGRHQPEHAGTVGYLVNLLPVLGDFGESADIDNVQHRTWRELRSALAAAEVPLARLIGAIRPPRHGQNPLFQATLTLQQSAGGRLDDSFAAPWSGTRRQLRGVTVRAVDVPPRDAAFALGLYGARDDDRLSFRLVRQEQVVSAHVAEEVVRHVVDGLRGIAAAHRTEGEDSACRTAE